MSESNPGVYPRSANLDASTLRRASRGPSPDVNAPRVLDAHAILLAERSPTPGVFRSPWGLARLVVALLVCVQAVVWFPALLRAVVR